MSERGPTEASVGLGGRVCILWRAGGQLKHRSSLKILPEGALGTCQDGPFSASGGGYAGGASHERARPDGGLRRLGWAGMYLVASWRAIKA